MRHCSRCKDDRNIERHHVYPKRFRRSFSREKHDVTLDMCHDCHKRLERLLWQLEKHIGRLPDEVYPYLSIHY